MAVRVRDLAKAGVVIVGLIAAGRTVPHWGDWISNLTGPDSTSMCADREIVQQFTAAVEQQANQLETTMSDKKTSYGSNGSYAPPTPAAPKVAVNVESVLATDFNRDIKRAVCQITFRVEGADRMSFVSLLFGQQSRRTVTYSVQPDVNGRLVASW